MTSKRNLGRAFREDFEEEAGVRFRPWKWFFATVAVVLIVLGVFYGIRWMTQPLRTAEGVRERVGNPDNVLFQYEHFHDLCGAVVATDQKIAAKQDEIADYDKRHPHGDPSDKYQAASKRDRLQTELTGLEQFRADQVAQYNADSAKHSRALFKDASLPDRIGDDTPVCN